MIKGRVVFVFSLHLLNGKLEFAHHFSKKHVVDENITIFFVQFITNTDQLEPTLHLLWLVEQIKSVQQINKAALSAMHPWSEQISNPKHQQINSVVVHANATSCPD